MLATWRRVEQTDNNLGGGGKSRHEVPVMPGKHC